MNGMPTGVSWYISVQGVDFGNETTLLLHTDTHYANIEPDGTMIMTPFVEGERVAHPTLRFSSVHRPQLLEAARRLLAPQLEERGREFGRLEGQLDIMQRSLTVEATRVDRMIGKLLSDVYE